MRLLYAIFSTLFFFVFANAQASYIGYPTNGTTVHRGEQITVQVVRPFSLQGSMEVGIVIGLYSCPPYPCPAPNQVGSILYKGTYDPVLHEMPGRPYQNFSVTVPTVDYFSGEAQLNVNRFHLIGAGPAAALESHALLVNVAP